MRVAVIQSNYLPWRGYFDLIHDVDEFIFYDDVQYTVNDWRNRNRVKTVNGVVWLTIPVGNQNDRRICDVELKDRSWARKHWLTVEQSYRRAAAFSRYEAFFRDFYARPWSSLSVLNQTLVTAIARDLLGIRTRIRDSREFSLAGGRADRLLSLLQQVGATDYYSGPAAQSYLDAGAYQRAGVTVHWKDYGDYPEYPQLHGAFAAGLSILDTLMNCGDETPYYVWGHRESRLARGSL